MPESLQAKIRKCIVNGSLFGIRNIMNSIQKYFIDPKGRFKGKKRARHVDSIF